MPSQESILQYVWARSQSTNELPPMPTSDESSSFRVLITTLTSRDVSFAGRSYSIYFERNAMVPALAHWVNAAPQPKPEDALRLAICEIFGNVTIGSRYDVDPEEGWSRNALVVHTSIDDLDARSELEDQFYARVANDQQLSEALRAMTVVFD